MPRSRSYQGASYSRWRSVATQRARPIHHRPGSTYPRTRTARNRWPSLWLALLALLALLVLLVA
jgi:hypothetical protein